MSSKTLNSLSTVDLLSKVRAGDDAARATLFERYLSRLRAWTRSRVPHTARPTTDTDDLVQDALLQTLQRVETFTPEHSGAFRGYIRRVLKSRLADAARLAERRPAATETASRIFDAGPSPLETAIGAESLDRYERAYQRLSLEDQSILTARLDDGITYRELAVEHGKPSSDAARMAVKRALMKLAREMGSVDA